MRKLLSTKELSEIMGVKQATILKGLCLNGHYLGMVPITLPNGRHRFDAEDAERLLNPEPRPSSAQK